MFPSWAFTDSTSSRCILFKGFTFSHRALISSSASVWVCVFVIVIFTNSTYQVQTRAELCISCDLIDFSLSRACVICLKIHWLKVVLFLLRNYSFQKLLFDFWGFIGFKQQHDLLFDRRFTHSGSSILWKFTLSVVVFTRSLSLSLVSSRAWTLSIWAADSNSVFHVFFFMVFPYGLLIYVEQFPSWFTDYTPSPHPSPLALEGEKTIFLLIIDNPNVSCGELCKYIFLEVDRKLFWTCFW